MGNACVQATCIETRVLFTSRFTRVTADPTGPRCEKLRLELRWRGGSHVTRRPSTASASRTALPAGLESEEARRRSVHERVKEPESVKELEEASMERRESEET